MTRTLLLRRIWAAFLCLSLSGPNPAFDRGNQALVAGNGAASASRSQALRPLQDTEGSNRLRAGLEEDVQAYQRLLDRPDVGPEVWKILQSGGRFYPGDSWIMETMKNKDSSGPQVRAVLSHPQNGGPTLQLSIKNDNPRFFMVEYTNLDGEAPVLSKDVYVVNGQNNLQLPRFLTEHTGLDLDETTPSLVNPFKIIPAGYILASSQKPDQGYTVVRSNRMNYLQVTDNGVPVGILSGHPERVHQYLKKFPNWLFFSAPDFSTKEADPPFLAWETLEAYVRGSTTVRPQIVFKPSGEGRLYLPRSEVDWRDFLENQGPALRDWYDEEIVPLLGEGVGLQTEVLEWEKKLSPYFQIIPVRVRPPAADSSAELRTGLEEDEEDTPGVPLFQGGHFTASEWIPFLSGYLQQVVREKKRPLQVQMAGPKGREEILLPLPGGMTDNSEKGGMSRNWDSNTFRTALRRIGVDPENPREYWTATLDELGGALNFRFVPYEAGSFSSEDRAVFISDDWDFGGSDEAENQAPEEWGLFPWENGQEPDWLAGQGGVSWGAAELLYKGSLKELAAWLERQPISDWKESQGISRIEIVFPDNPPKISRKIHNLEGPNDMDIHWIAERILKEVSPIVGWDAPYEAVWIKDRVEIRPAPPSSESAAGLEEKRGFVAVGSVGLLLPPRLSPDRYYVVAVGLEQAAALIAAGRAPGRIIAVATGLKEVEGLLALGIPGDQIVQVWDWPTLEAAKNYAVRLGREWLAGLGGLQVSVLEVTARSLQGILAQLREILPSAWQTVRPITAEDAVRALDLEA